MIRAVPFASCYVYSPAGSGALCNRSRLLRAMLKEADAHFLRRYAHRVHQQALAPTQLAGFFTPDDVLVPVPGSRATKGDAGVAAHLADALLREGLGCASWRGLHRAKTVVKSATADPGRRPSVQLHYDSFVIDPAISAPGSLVLIDDVITKGRTLLAAAARLQEAFPAARVRAFALLRTLGMRKGVRRLIQPCQGDIRFEYGDAHRCP